ncbi:hypothetical protein PUN28_010600 [Cardiocondyla obscurior]|uniref:Uncharacterized protein n=1 Tax=Cardiocondyla obscurior TaxID=286306 RepID=A0AAW2FK21_9HYME
MTPASVCRDHVRGAFCAFYAERSSLIHFDHRLRSIPRIQRLSLGRRIPGRVLRRAGRSIARTVTRSIRRASVSLAGACSRLPYEFRRLSINAARLSARLGTLKSLIRRVV